MIFAPTGRGAESARTPTKAAHGVSKLCLAPFLPSQKHLQDKRSYSPTREAHSLVEMLVVVGIIAILVALLLPSLYAAKERGRRVACMGNLRQIHSVMMAYAEDFEGYLPWSGIQDGRVFLDLQHLYPTDIGNGAILLCPSDMYNQINGFTWYEIDEDDSPFASFMCENYYAGHGPRDRPPISMDSHPNTWIWRDLQLGDKDRKEALNHGPKYKNILRLSGAVEGKQER